MELFSICCLLFVLLSHMSLDDVTEHCIRYISVDCQISNKGCKWCLEDKKIFLLCLQFH